MLVNLQKGAISHKRLGTTALDHSSYDFHVFGSLKEALGGQRFNDYAEVELMCAIGLHTQLKMFLKQENMLTKDLYLFFIAKKSRLY